MKNYVTAVWAEPFSGKAPTARQWRHGMSVAEIVHAMECLPFSFSHRGEVRIAGEIVPPSMWRYVRPRADERAIITFHLTYEGGGQGGGAKQIIGIVAALALTVITGGIASGALGTALGIASLGAGTLGATLLAGAVGVAGSLALAALTAAPTTKVGDDTAANGDDNRAASASGNSVPELGGPIDRVVGKTKIFPKLAGQPVISIEDRDDWVEAAFILNGPHKIEDVRVDGAPIEVNSDVQIQYREGWEDDQPIDLFERYGRQTGAQFELSAHQVQAEAMGTLLTQNDPQASLPVWHGVPTRRSPNEVWMRLVLPSAGFKSNENQLVIPIRVRMRLRGTNTWVNLPQYHISSQSLSPFKHEIQIKWDDPNEPEGVNQVPSRDGVTWVANSVRPQTAVPASTGYTAHSYFSSGSGSGYLFRGNESSSSVRHAYPYSNRIEFHLKSSIFPKGLYDIQVKRGFSFNAGNFDLPSGNLSGNNRDFFWYNLDGGVANIAESRDGKAEQILHQHTTSVWNERILPVPGFAVIAIRARNKQINNVSCLASGYVKDYNPATDAWDTWVTTSNPAPHYRDVHIGRQNVDPLPLDLLDDAEILEWRNRCANENYTCNEIIADQSVDDVRGLIASCGYARPYQSDLWGIVQDYDRSAESVVQIFSPRNARGFSIKKAFTRLPDGFRVNFRDKSSDYETEEVVVFRAGYTGSDDGRLENVTYGGLDEETKVVMRAGFDLAQAEKRATFYNWEAAAESIVCRRGSMVGIEHDILARHSGRARIKEVIVDPTTHLITGLVLDSVIPVYNTPDMHSVADMHAVTDMHMVGLITSIAIRRSNGWITLHAVTSSTPGETDTLQFVTPLADLWTPGSVFDPELVPEIGKGCLIISGTSRKVFKRVIVTEMRPTSELTFNIVAVDEAPDLWYDGLTKYLLQESGYKLLQESNSGIVIDG